MDTNKKSQKIAFFFCEKCEYSTHNKTDYNKHLLTLKHKNLTNPNKNIVKIAKPFTSNNCEKKYKH